MSSKARVAPFSCLARVSEYPLSKLGALITGREKRLTERADDTLSAKMLLRFSQLAKRAECLALRMILAKRTSLT